jgi:Anthrone oxygenase
MRLKTVQFVSLVLVMLVTGVFWGSWLGLSRSIQTFTPDTFLAIGHTMIGNLAPVMPLLVILAAISQGLLLVQLRSSGSSAFLPSLIAFVMFLIAVAVTLLVEVPIDNQIRSWTPASLPADWTLIRDRWEAFHVLRTFSALGGLIVLPAATVFGPLPSGK